MCIRDSHNILAEASRLIQTTPQTFFTGKDLADRVFVCERTLSNQFKKAYGKTLYAYQMDVKLEMVRQFLLSQPEVKLHEKMCIRDSHLHDPAEYIANTFVIHGYDCSF